IWDPVDSEVQRRAPVAVRTKAQEEAASGRPALPQVARPGPKRPQATPSYASRSPSKGSHANRQPAAKPRPGFVQRLNPYSAVRELGPLPFPQASPPRVPAIH